MNPERTTSTGEAKAPAGAARTSTGEHDPIGTDGNRPIRVLVAEDERMVREAICVWLRRHSFEVIEAKDGVGAVRAAAETAPDLALVDYGLPDVDGLRVAQVIKAGRGGDLPILVMSGHRDLGVRVGAFDAGADDFIPKPVHMPELLRRLDTSYRKHRALAREQQARKRAEQTQLYAAEAAALIAHDINNGLATAMCNLELVAEVCGELADEDAADALAATICVLKRMAGLTKNFVDVGRLEDNAVVVRAEPVDLGTLLSRTAEIHEPAASTQKVAIEVDCPENLVAQLDPVLVERMLHNLVGNATRYASHGGQICLRARRRGSDLEIEVANTGPTLPAEMRPLLFEKYRTGKDGKALRGMGLYFCRLACEAHGGTIELIDDDELDVCFRARLPGA